MEDRQRLGRSWLVVKIFGGETADSYSQAIWLMPASFLVALACAQLLRETSKE